MGGPAWIQATSLYDQATATPADFGWSLREARATQAERVEVLLLIAALAMLVGLMAEEAGAYRAYQANTVTSRRVLSHFVLGNLILQDACLPHRCEIPIPVGFAPIHTHIREMTPPCGPR
jgi:hypothetical protein